MRRLLPALCLLASLPQPACRLGDPEPPALRLGFQEQFRIGPAVGPRSTRADEQALLLRHFNSVCTENVLKMGPVHPEEGRYDLARTPSLEIIGPEYIELAFRRAHEADPDAELYYNDYRETDPVKRGKIIRLVTDLRHRGVPVHGIGLQCHWSVFGPKEAELEVALMEFAATGLPLHITELDVSVWPGEPARREKRSSDADDRLTPERARAQEELYAISFRLFPRHADRIDAVTFWNISDRHSWLDDWPVRGRNDRPLLFDESLRPKPAYWRVVEGR